MHCKKLVAIATDQWNRLRSNELREPRRSIVKDEPTAQMMAYRPSGLLTENSSKSLNPIIVINSGVRRNAVDGR